MPTLEDSSFVATSVFHRAPLSMSADDSQGRTALMIFGSQFRRVSAKLLLRPPDQLMNTSIVVIVQLPSPSEYDADSPRSFGSMLSWMSRGSARGWA